MEITDRHFVFDFIMLDMTSFDIILGMDWLASYCATICFQYRVTFCTPEGDHFHFERDRVCCVTPLSTDARRQRELNFLFQLV